MMKTNALFKKRWFAALLKSFILLIVLELLIMFNFFNGFWVLTIMSLFTNIILATSLNLINGFTGQFSLGHAGFMAVGGYTAAVLALNFAPSLIKAGIIPSLHNVTLKMPWGLPDMFLPFAKAIAPGGIVLLFSLLLGGILAALMGFLIGLPTLRLRGDYLAIATLGFGEIIRLTFLNINYLGSASGMPGIPQYATVMSCVVVAIITVYAISNVVRSTHGRAMLAVREDEMAAQTVGINTTRYKVTAFTIGAFFAGVAGALYAHTFYLVNPSIFSLLKSIDVLVMVVLGGQGSIGGSIAGAVLVTILNAFLSNFPEIRMIVYSVVLVLMIIFMPHGLLTVRDLFARFRPKAGEPDNAAPDR